MSSSNLEETDLPGLLEDLDRLIHEPARLLIVALLSVVESADFTFLMQQTGFANPHWQPYTFGIAGLYTGMRPTVL